MPRQTNPAILKKGNANNKAAKLESLYPRFSFAMTTAEPITFRVKVAEWKASANKPQQTPATAVNGSNNGMVGWWQSGYLSKTAVPPQSGAHCSERGSATSEQHPRNPERSVHHISTMKVTLFAGLVILPLLTAVAGPVHSRQEDSQTDYTGYTLEGCDNMFAVCKGHLAHPGHVPGGMKQCQSEMSRCGFLETK